MTQQEILETIYPVIRMHRAAGGRFDITRDDINIKLTPGNDHAFGSSFITDLGNVCRENLIVFFVGAEGNNPYILL